MFLSTVGFWCWLSRCYPTENPSRRLEAPSTCPMSSLATDGLHEIFLTALWEKYLCHFWGMQSKQKNEMPRVSIPSIKQYQALHQELGKTFNSAFFPQQKSFPLKGSYKPGWGFPFLEAMWLKKTQIVTNISLHDKIQAVHKIALQKQNLIFFPVASSLILKKLSEGLRLCKFI